MVFVHHFFLSAIFSNFYFKIALISGSDKSMAFHPAAGLAKELFRNEMLVFLKGDKVISISHYLF
jgi:hypothetical protein